MSIETKKRGPSVGLTKEARRAQECVEYGAIRAKADELGISIKSLCERAGVPFGSVATWVKAVPRTFAAQEKLSMLLSVTDQATAAK